MKIDRVIVEQVLEEYHKLATAGEKLAALIQAGELAPEVAGESAAHVARVGRFFLDRLARTEEYGAMKWMSDMQTAFQAVGKRNAKRS